MRHSMHTLCSFWYSTARVSNEQFCISKNQSDLLPEHSNSFKCACSLGSHSQSVSWSVGIMSYLLASSISTLPLFLAMSNL